MATVARAHGAGVFLPSPELLARSRATDTALAGISRVLIGIFRPPDLFPDAHNLERLTASRLAESGAATPPTSTTVPPPYSRDPMEGEVVLDHNSRRRRRRALTESYALQLQETQARRQGRPGLRSRAYSAESVFFAEVPLDDEEEEPTVAAPETSAPEEQANGWKRTIRVFVLPAYEPGLEGARATPKRRPGLGRRGWSWAAGVSGRGSDERS